MVTKTSFLNLNMYNTIADSGVNFGTFIQDISGSATDSNTTIFDKYASTLGISSTGSSGSIARVTGSMVIISASNVLLNNQVFGTIIASASFNQITVDNYGKVISGSVVRPKAGGIILTNRSGSFLPAGSTAIFSASYGADFFVTNIPGDDAICGITTEDRDNNAETSLAVAGAAPILVTGSVAVGHWLITSACTGRAFDSCYTVKPDKGAIGIALTSCSASGSVIADLRIRPFSAVSRLRQLPTSGCAISGVAATALTFNYSCDNSADLLIVRCGGNLTSITSVTYGGIPMRPIFNAWGATNEGQGMFYLRYPPWGGNDIVINVPSNQTIKAVATNYTGHEVTSTGSPVRLVATGGGSTLTTVTITPVVYAGDILINMAVAVSSAAFMPLEEYHQSEVIAYGTGRKYYFGQKNYFINKMDNRMSWYDRGTDNIYMVGVAICGTKV
jgi:hypothetical protein